MWQDQKVIIVAICTKELTKEANLAGLYDAGLVPTLYVARKDINNPPLLMASPDLTGVYLVMGVTID